MVLLKYVKNIFRTLRYGPGINRFFIVMLVVPIGIAITWSLSPVMDNKEGEMQSVCVVVFLILLGRTAMTLQSDRDTTFSISKNLIWGSIYILFAAGANIALFALFRPEHEMIGLFQGKGVLSVSVVALGIWLVYAPAIVMLNNWFVDDRKKSRLNGQLALFEETNR